VEAQRDHGEVELAQVDGAAAVGVEEVEDVLDLLRLGPGQRDAVAAVGVRAGLLRRAEVQVELEAAGDVADD
jgi:hypothetical protein